MNAKFSRHSIDDSDGGGRSGVFLCIDANLESSEEDGVYEVYGYLKKIRQARRGLVETLDQYKFVYDTLEESLQCGSSWFPVSELSSRLKTKSMRNADTKINEYQKEYEVNGFPRCLPRCVT